MNYKGAKSEHTKNFSEVGCRKFSKSLKWLPKLKNLSFNFACQNLFDNSAACLAKRFIKMT